MSKYKQCVTCGKAKTIAEFPNDGKGPRPHCNACFNASRRGGTSLNKQGAAKPIDYVAEHRLKERVSQLEIHNRQLIKDLSDARAMHDLRREVASVKVKGITPRERKSRLREATPLVLVSDLHLEEQVRPEQVSGRNQYNLEISKRRMERLFEGVRFGIEFNRQIFKIRDLCLWLGGDIITNYLHPDNIESNLLSPVQAIAYAETSITDGILHLLQDKQLERIVIPCNDGNHGRLTEKMRSSSRIENSIEWLLYTNLAKRFAKEPRVQFQIAESEHLYYDIYGRTIRFTHGDTVRYGGGVGGIMIPLYKAMSRWQTVRHAHLTCVGHFHQYTSLNDLIVNGSLIGYSPYALSIGARFEPPTQAMTMLDSVRFKSVDFPIWVADAKDDKFA